MYTFRPAFKFEPIVDNSTDRDCNVDTLAEATEAIKEHFRLWGKEGDYEFFSQVVDEFTPRATEELEKVREFNRYMEAKNVALHVYAEFLPN